MTLAHSSFNSAISLAERRSDSTHLAQFVLLEAKSHFCKDATDSQEKTVYQILSNLRKLTAEWQGETDARKRQLWKSSATSGTDFGKTDSGRVRELCCKLTRRGTKPVGE